MNREWMPSVVALKATAPFIIVLLALGLATFPTLEAIGSRWLMLDESYSHGLLLLVVSIGLICRAAARKPVAPGFYPVWLVPFALCLLGYWLGSLIRLQALQQLVLVPMLLSVFAVLMGWKQVRWFLVPVGLLFLTIPVWDFLAWPLQIITVAVNKLWLGVFNIDFEIEGVFVHLVGVGTFEVAHGCSGLRYLLVGQALALIYGEMYLSRLRSKVSLFLLAVVFALIANWIRVFVIFYVGYETNMESSLIHNHENFGWWLFGATLIPLYFIAGHFEKRDEAAVDSNVQAANRQAAQPASAGVAVLALLVVVAATWMSLPEKRPHVTQVPAGYEINLPQYAPAFGRYLAGWKPQVIHPDRMYAQTLFDRNEAKQQGAADQALYLGVFTYDYQRRGAELIQYSNRLYDKEVWIPERFFEITPAFAGKVQGVTLKNRITGQKLHLAYSYFVENLWETDEWQAKLAQIQGFFSNRTDANLLIGGLTCEQCEPEKALSEFVNASFPAALKEINLERATLK
jgi:exosortase